jgi:hypothetical protein
MFTSPFGNASLNLPMTSSRVSSSDATSTVKLQPASPFGSSVLTASIS